MQSSSIIINLNKKVELPIRQNSFKMSNAIKIYTSSKAKLY